MTSTATALIECDQLIIGGSFNYTGPANQLNDENIVVLGDLNSRARRSIRQQKRLAAFAKAEIDRIIAQHAEPLPARRLRDH